MTEVEEACVKEGTIEEPSLTEEDTLITPVVADTVEEVTVDVTDTVVEAVEKSLETVWVGTMIVLEIAVPKVSDDMVIKSVIVETMVLVDTVGITDVLEVEAVKPPLAILSELLGTD